MRGWALGTVLVTAAGCSAPAPRVVARESCTPPAATTLWLDFEGANVAYASSDDSAASPVQSQLAPTTAVVPPFDSGPIVAPALTREQAIAAVADRVRTIFADFAVDVVTTRPAAPPFTRVLIGGSSSALGMSSSEAGLALVDCDNADPRNVAFDFSADQTPDYGGVVGIANTAAHEAAHTFGLEHVDRVHDVMYVAAMPALTLPDLFTLSFGSGNFTDYGGQVRQCTSVDPVDEVALLGCNVGLRDRSADDHTAPTLNWTPPAGNVVGALDVTVDASDAVGVARVEFYKNLELLASVSAPPYTAHVAAAPGEHFWVTVEAIDAAANRNTVTHAFTAAASTTGADGGVSGDGSSVPPGGLEQSSSSSGGCALAPAAAPASAWPLALAFAAYGRRRRRR